MLELSSLKQFILLNFHRNPKILDNLQSINMIIEKGYSIARICDGQFFLMLEDQGFTFQYLDNSLSTRLFEVLNSKEEGLLIVIQRGFAKHDLDFTTSSSKQ